MGKPFNPLDHIKGQTRDESQEYSSLTSGKATYKLGDDFDKEKEALADEQRIEKYNSESKDMKKDREYAGAHDGLLESALGEQEGEPLNIIENQDGINVINADGYFTFNEIQDKIESVIDPVEEKVGEAGKNQEPVKAGEDDFGDINPFLDDDFSDR